MPRNEQPQTVTGDDLMRVGNLLEHFAERYNTLAGKLHEEQIDHLTVRSWKMMLDSIDRIQRAVNRAYEAFDAAKIANAFGDEAVEIANEVEKKKTAKKRSPRKKSE